MLIPMRTFPNGPHKVFLFLIATEAAIGIVEYYVLEISIKISKLIKI